MPLAQQLRRTSRPLCTLSFSTLRLSVATIEALPASTSVTGTTGVVTDTGSEDVIGTRHSAGLGPLSRHTKEQGTVLKGETPLKIGLNVPQHNFTDNKRAGNQNTTGARNVRTPCTQGEAQAITKVLTATNRTWLKMALSQNEPTKERDAGKGTQSTEVSHERSLEQSVTKCRPDQCERLTTYQRNTWKNGTTSNNR